MYAFLPCPHCQTLLRTLPEKAGQTIRCWSCRTEVEVPQGLIEKEASDRALSSRRKWSLIDPLHSPRAVLVGAAVLGLALAAVAFTGLHAMFLAAGGG